jgi:hypothetical protein
MNATYKFEHPGVAVSIRISTIEKWAFLASMTAGGLKKMREIVAPDFAG